MFELSGVKARSKGYGNLVRDNKSSSYLVFQLSSGLYWTCNNTFDIPVFIPFETRWRRYQYSARCNQ